MGLLTISGLIWVNRGIVRAVPTTVPVFSTAPATESIVQSPNHIEFPFVLGNAGLIVTNIVSFEGLLPGVTEDIYGDNILAIEVYNPKSSGIVNATITLTQDGNTFYFDLEYLPSGSKALILERNGHTLDSTVFESCECLQFSRGDFVSEIPGIQITEENGILTIQNLSDTVLPEVTLYYKQYTGGFYVGKAMSVQFDTLLPGEKLSQPVYGYAESYSRIAAIIPKQ